MLTHQIHVSTGRETVGEIRRHLLLFSEVVEVYATGKPDILVVVYAGRPRPGEWLTALRAVGYHVPTRRHATWRRRAPMNRESGGNEVVSL